MSDNQLAPASQPPAHAVTVFSAGGFEVAQRMAKALSAASLIPEQFRNDIPNCLIALEMANRIGASPLMVMQNLYVIHGRPSWSSQFVIGALNSTGRFTPLRFKMEGEGDARSCIACATDRETKELLEGPSVSMKMARDEGWLGKSGSKWKTMPELMLRYRAATFFGRLYAPEVLMGMKEETEAQDMPTEERVANARAVGEPERALFSAPEKKEAPRVAALVEELASDPMPGPTPTPVAKKTRAAKVKPEEQVREGEVSEPEVPTDNSPLAQIRARAKAEGLAEDDFVLWAVQTKCEGVLPTKTLAEQPESVLSEIVGWIEDAVDMLKGKGAQA